MRPEARLILGLCAFWLASAVADGEPQSRFEEEPNNTPAEANDVSAPAILVGTMNKGDQDGFMWRVSDEDAQQRWVLELHGIPGRLTVTDIVRIEFAENGTGVATKDKLTQMGTRDGYTPAITRDLLFEPGEYLLGMAYAGGSPGEQASGGGMFRPPANMVTFGEDGTPDAPGDAVDGSDPDAGAYRLVLREGSRMVLDSGNQLGATKDNPITMRPGREVAMFETREEVWYAFGFAPGDEGRRWDLRVQVPVGRTVDASLLAPDGTELTSQRSGARGHLEFPDVAPTEGAYLLRLRLREPGFITAVSSEAVGTRVVGEEAEPNGKTDLANHVVLAQPVTGRINPGNEWDYFRFDLAAGEVDQLLRLRIETAEPGQAMEFCLLDESFARVQCRRATTPIELPDLLLSPGAWGLSVTRAAEGVEYSISLEEQGPIEAGVETEPNDTAAFASSVPANNRIKGRASGDEDDVFRFIVAEEPQLWRFQVIGDNLTEVAYLDGAGTQAANVRPRGGQRRVRLDNVFLLPGTHYLKVSGRDGAEYTVLARPLGPPDPNGEREPNDDTSRMQRLAMGQTRTGYLSDASDTDHYRFFIPNEDHVRLTVTPPPDGIVAPHVHWYNSSFAQGIPSEPGQVMEMDGIWPPGDYYVALTTNQPSDAEYQISLERLPRWSCAVDCEPNGLSTYYRAASLPPNFKLQGRAGEWRDNDVYQLPRFDRAQQLLVRTAQAVHGRVYLQQRHETEHLRHDPELGAYPATVPAGEPWRLVIETRDSYQLQLEFPGGPQAHENTAFTAEIDLTLETDTVAAYRSYGQRVGGEIVIRNSADGVLQGRIEATASDYRWSVKLESEEVAVARNGTATVPLEVQVPADAWADHPVRISVRVVGPDNAHVETWAELSVARETAPVRPAFNWVVPDALRGGFNAAWLPFGGEIVGEIPSYADSPLLRDGLVFAGTRVNCCSETYGWKDTRPSITLKLPGEKPLPVAGMALNLFGAPWPYRDLRRATLLLSSDGQAYEEVLQLETLPVETEQYFPLAQPVMANFARLQLDETYEFYSGAGGVTMGEWKVILAPGHDLSGGEGFDIARPELGGHLVWEWPATPYHPDHVLEPDKTPNDVRSKPDIPLEYVFGFHENRAAQISSIDWINPESMRAEYATAKVVISVGMESPLGPWERIGEIAPGDQPGTTTLQLERPVWARFVKFTGLRQGESSIVMPPQLIRIWERPTSEDYRSVLSEWGHANRQAFYEAQAGLPPEPELQAAGNRSKANAAALAPGQPAAGRVALGKYEHWYRLDLPADANTLTLAVGGEPTVRTVLAAEDAAGAPLPLRPLPLKSTPREHVFEVFADPGSSIWFKVSEPPRNVIFTWDTSPSVNAWLPTIYNALAAFTSQVVPGQEAVNFVPFGRSPLLDRWYGEPYVLQTILNDYPRRESSSSAESTLKTSARALAPVAGAKAILVISDGETTHDGTMWEAMQEVQPRVFAVGVAANEAWTQDRQEDWADINGGHFKYLNYLGEMEIAFDRAATILRRPAEYTLLAEAEFREAPGPGLLQVTAGGGDDGAGASSAGVELILDASGSMLQRMGGKRRIEVAREVLTEAVRTHIPAGTPVALRVFGHTEPGTCHTALEMPLAPLDPEAAAQKIGSIQAMNLAKTPIADSLAAVAGDLKGAQGTAAVVLVTDGEETCDGDPAAVIQSLADKGIEVNLNIVGFAIDDAELEATFSEWAKLGGGSYFSARDQQGLSGAIEEALQLQFRVLDSTGEVVAEGRVGGAPLEIERGVYRVVVATSPPRIFEDVEVAGEDEIVLELE